MKIATLMCLAIASIVSGSDAATITRKCPTRDPLKFNVEKFSEPKLDEFLKRTTKASGNKCVFTAEFPSADWEKVFKTIRDSKSGYKNEISKTHDAMFKTDGFKLVGKPPSIQLRTLKHSKMTKNGMDAKLRLVFSTFNVSGVATVTSKDPKVIAVTCEDCSVNAGFDKLAFTVKAKWNAKLEVTEAKLETLEAESATLKISSTGFVMREKHMPNTSARLKKFMKLMRKSLKGSMRMEQVLKQMLTKILSDKKDADESSKHDEDHEKSDASEKEESSDDDESSHSGESSENDDDSSKSDDDD